MDMSYAAFLKSLEREDRQSCVEMVLGRLAQGQIDIPTLYQQVLTPAMRERIDSGTGKPLSIWQEHIRTSIVRTVIECCYPYVLKEVGRGRKRGRLIICCPAEELHEIGARMAMDFFLLNGFEAIFIGANTPQHEILEAIEDAMPDYVALSVSNYYNLMAARKAIQQIIDLRERKQLGFKIIAGGTAFEGNVGRSREIGADLLLQTHEDIKRFAEAL